MSRRLLALTLSLLLVHPSAQAHELSPPRPLEQPEARWPGGAAGTHDVVVPVLLVVGESGAVREAVVEASLGKALDEAALEAARRWRFEPARREGRPVEARVRAFVRFNAARRASEPTAQPPRASDPVAVEGHGQHEHHEHHAAAPPKVVTVQGARLPTRSASETVRERPVLAAAPHRTAADMLRTVPGVFVTQHSGDGKAYQIFFRGFDAAHGQDTELWAGGAPVNDVSNIHGQGYADLHFVPTEVVREIRSQPGTYDARQGDFAVAGTMRLSLGLDEPGVMAKASGGSFGARRYLVAYRPDTETDETFAAFESYSTDGFGPARAARRAGALGQAAFDVSESLRLRVLASTYAGRFDAAGVLTLAEAQRPGADRFATHDGAQGGASSRSQLVVELTDARRGERYAITPFVIWRGFTLRSNFTGALTSPLGDLVQQRNDARTAGLTAYHRFPVPLVSSRDLLEAGVFGRHDVIDQSQRRLASADGSVQGTDVDAAVLATNVAGYADITLYPHRRLMLRGGLRVDGLACTVEDRGGVAQGEARSAQGTHLGKKASAELMTLPGLSVVASYGEGFRSPQARALSQGQTTPFTAVQSAEAGLRYRDDQLRGSLAAFSTWLTDDLVFDQALARNERVPGTVRRGIAAELTAIVPRLFASSASATFTHASFRQTGEGRAAGELVPYAPQVVLRTDLAATPTLGQVGGRTVSGRLGFATSFLDRRPLPYAEWGHAIFLLDASAAARIGEAELSLDAYNLLGAAWYDGEYTYASRFDAGPASLVPRRHVTVGAPRTLMLSLTLHVKGLS